MPASSLMSHVHPGYKLPLLSYMSLFQQIYSVLCDDVPHLKMLTPMCVRTTSSCFSKLGCQRSGIPTFSQIMPKLLLLLGSKIFF